MTDARRPSSACLDLETIAAYLDKMLSPAERTAVEAHLAECSACYEQFAEIAQLNADLQEEELQEERDNAGKVLPMPARRWPVRGILSGLAAASLVLLAWASWTMLRPASGVEDQIASLSNATAAERFTRGRLSAARQWAPAPSANRGSGDGRTELSLEAQQTAITLQQRAAGERTAVSIRGAGIALLALGRLDAAIEALNEAVEMDPSNAAAQNDLAAALLDRASATGDAYDAARALHHAERAVHLDGSHAGALFNRALAHEAIGNRPQAIEAWREYLKIDGDGPWASEARERLAVLEKAVASRPSAESLASLTDDDLRALARRHRGWLDRVLAITLLPAWIAASARDEGALIARIAGALNESGGPTAATMLAASVRDSVRWTEPRRRCLADAIASYARWTTAVDRGERTAGLAAADQVSRALACADVDPVLASLPTVWGMVSSARFADARSVAERAADQAAQAGYWSLEAALCEQLAAIAIQDTRLSDAGELRRRGRAAAEKAHDREGVARFESLLGEAFDEQGDRPAAWAHFRSAIQTLEGGDAPLHRYEALAAATIAASHAGLTGAAAAFADQLLDAAEATGRTTLRIMALLQRGRARAALGDANGASDVLAGAALLPKIPEERRRQAWTAEVGWVTGLVMASTAPSTAVQGLSDAIEYFDRTGRRFRLAELLLHRGRIYRALGNADAAHADFMRGTAVLEDQRPAIREEQLRISRTSEIWDLFTQLIELQGDDAEASLQVLERAKARELLGALARDREQHALTVEALKGCLPGDTTAVVYAALPDKLHVWEIDRQHVVRRTHAVARTQLERWVAAFQRDVMTGTTGNDGRMLSERLLPRELPRHPASTLVIVPDGPLERLPFAALPTPRGYLVETAVPLIAPSLTTFCHTSRRGADAPASAVLVGVAEPIADAGLPALPEIPREIAAIEKLYPSREVLLAADATVPAITDAWSRHGIVHFAGHAVTNDQLPYQSRLFTHPGVMPASLTFADIASTRLRPGSLVVLAACQTAAGRTFDGEGTMSLARPFLAAGASAVLGSLWNIRDADARTVVERVHARIAAGDRLDRALAQTQRALIQASAPVSAWSGYLVTGGIPEWSQRLER